MTLSEQIAQKNAALIAAKDALVAAQKNYSEKPDDDESMTALETAISEVEEIEKKLDLLKRAESALKSEASRAPAVVKSFKTKEGSADLLFKAALVSFESHVTHQPLEAIIQKHFGDDDGVRAVVGETNKAAQNPAQTNVAGYAQELTRQTYADFMNLLMPVSAVANLAFSRYSFDGFASIYIPMRIGSRTAQPNLSGAFRAEGTPIRVGALTLGSKILTPKTMGVIGTFTEEILRRSTPSILQVIRNAMLEDTSIMLDGVVLGTGAGSAIEPAGIANNLGSFTFAASGATPEDIHADLVNAIRLQSNALLGRNPAWVMTPGNAVALGGALNPLGQPMFPGMSLLRGQRSLYGYPVIETTNIANSRVLLIDQPEISFAGGAPEFLGSQVATLHEESAAPLPLATGPQGTAVVATPQRSLYQTFSQALRTVWTLDWWRMRDGSVVEITGVAW